MSLQHAEQQAHRWSGALKAKKAALENLVMVQKSLEEIEEEIAEHLSVEVIEGAHMRYITTLHPSNPEAIYIVTIGRVVIRPRSSHLGICSRS